MRHDSPVSFALTRFPKQDMDIRGTTIKAGDPILLSLLAANRDPRRFPDPDRLDITRDTQNRHVGFGHGLHNCLGAALGRLEAQIAVPAFFRRFPAAALAVPADQIEYDPSFLLRHVVEMPVDLR